MKFASFIIGLVIPFVGWSFEEIDWKLTLQGGYSALGRVQAANVRNSFPLQVGLGSHFNDTWSSKIEYQWIGSEHDSVQAINIQSIRLVPRYDFIQNKNHRLGFEGGLGYQWINLDQIDRVRQIELLAGPVWNYQVVGPWNLESSLRYAQSSMSLSSQALHRFEFILGITFEFGESRSHFPTQFVDSDQDGIANENDQCPNTTFGSKVSKIGCPPDNDGDLVADIHDYCPNTKRGSEVDEIGCPLNTSGRGLIDGISFERNSPRLTTTSKDQLSNIAENLKKFPNIYFIIEGYSSEAPTASEKITISKARAMTVLNVLASYGVPTNKMKAVGLSDLYPLTESTDESDRILNERIEIKWKHRL